MGSYVIVHQAPGLGVSVENHQPNRRSANYHPTIWGEHFLAYSSNVKEGFSKELAQEHERLKEEVRKMVTETCDKSGEKLDLVDAIQRLGVSYHFATEVDASLRSIYESYDHLDYDDLNDDEELHAVSLRFRLLRNHGYNVSSDVFKKFMDPEGNFKESLVRNVRGLLDLYEAANYRFHDEDILEDALNFSTSQLQFMLPSLNNSLAAQVNRALDMPIQKTLTRLGARQFMSFYKEDYKSHDPLLLKFAKFDFKILQKLHQEELSALTKWWKGLDCPKNTPFARDRVAECYLWILAVYFEPEYSYARSTMTKVVALASIIDDIYDVYGTLDELDLLTQAMERWDISAVDQLPSYMRPCFKGFFDVYSEMEKGWSQATKTNAVNHAISSLITLAKAYHEEAKWLHSGYLPTYEEYMKIALVTSTYPTLTKNALVCMGDIVSEDSLDWIAKNPPILNASSLICRLMDDIVSSEAEKERGELASAVECYTADYGVSKEEAVAEFNKQITDAWKDINKEWVALLGPAPVVPKLVLERILNLSKFMYFLYREDDGYTNAFNVAKDVIKLVLVDPIEI